MLKLLVLLAVFMTSPAIAADVKPTDDSIKQLLTVTETRKLVDGLMIQMDGMMKNAMQQALRGKTISPNEQKIIDSMQAKTVALVKQELNWDDLESLYIGIYRDSFTQQEVDGMLAFYKTPSGQALIRKMPVVIQKSMLEMQKRMGPLMKKMEKIQAEALTELKAQPKK